MNKKTYFLSSLFAWGLVIFLIGNYVFGWTTPSEDPPGGNIVLETGATPAGSTGHIQFNDAGNLGADSNLFWDNTNKKLGIGTTTPAYKLDVNGTAEMNTLSIGGTAVTATAAELNYVDGVTSAIQTQLGTKAPLASPTFTGTPAAPTAAAGTNTTQLATTAFVTTAVGSCGTGFTNVGTYCIQTNEAGSGTWWAAADYCSDNYGARLCSASEWYGACINNLLTNGIDDWEWVDDWYDSGGVRLFGSGACATVYGTGVPSSSYAFRCCK